MQIDGWCKYKYKHFLGKRCPYKALEEKDVCYWHEERDEKNPSKELETKDFRGFDLIEAFLQKAILVETNLQKANFERTNLRKANFG